MIVYKNNDLIVFETCSIFPNSDWTGKADYIVDETNPDNQVLISKIYEYAPYFDYVLDDNGRLVDVVKTQDKPVYPSPQSEIEILREESNLLKAQIKALSESNMFLEECLVEMAEIVYA
jgi:hypothetical protein